MTAAYRHNGRRAKVQELKERGHTGVEIAEILGVRPSLVYNHVHGIKIRKRTYNGAENRAKVQEQWDKGLGSKAIARVTGLPRSTVQHHIYMIKKENKEMPAKPHPQRDRILGLSGEGLKPRQIADELGIQQKEAAGVVYYARKAGKIPPAGGRKGLRYLMEKNPGGLRLGRLGALYTELTPDQQEWLFMQCTKLKTGTVIEYLIELVRDEYEEERSKSHD